MTPHIPVGNHAACGVWRLVCMPDGARVCALPRYDEFNDAASLFGMAAVDCYDERGFKVSVSGSHIARGFREELASMPAERARIDRLIEEKRLVGSPADALVVDDRTWARGRVTA